MYVNWAHYFLPKFSFFLSLVSNPLFVYLIRNNKNVSFGNYRYLLYFFAIFNLFSSAADLLIPLRSEIGEIVIGYRCAFISGTYAILNVHFVFRYLTLKKNSFINEYFMPHGLVITVTYVIIHMVIWGLVDWICFGSASEMRDYMKFSFAERFNGTDFNEINFVGGQFSETSSGISTRSWAGILLLTVLAGYSMILYFVLGYKIITGLNVESVRMSQKTARMQKQLFKALTIQTVIPICVSFMPCTLCFYGAVLKVEFPNFIYWGSTVAVSMFPFMDPMAIIFFLPALRKRIQTILTRATTTVSIATQSHNMNSELFF